MLDIFFANLLQTEPAGTATRSEMHPLELILNASFIVQLVMFILFAMSVVCWFIIGAKAVRLSQAA
ncbi:MAG: hypothetical protein H5U40_04850, partial [Polyangiaceae bacterium]|nr:hypothetical protein [Polyangiaceae bacterium]